MKKATIFAAAVFLVIPTALRPDVLSLTGYYKNFFTVLSPPVYTIGNSRAEEPEKGSVSNTLRLNLFFDPLNWLSVHGAYEVSLKIQDPSLFDTTVFLAGTQPASYRLNDLRSMIYPEPDEEAGSFGAFHNLDRLYVTVKTEFADIFIGRQAIAWGSARIISPIDIIAPYTFYELDTEERRGVDALRVRIPLGMMDELDLGYIGGEDFDWEKSALFLRGKLYVLSTDLSLILTGFREHLLIGADVARSIGGAGFWLEAAYVIPSFFTEEDTDENHYSRVSVGLDYNFSAKLYGYMEYHFNSSGEKSPEHYTRFLSSTAFQHGSVYLMGKHYLGVGSTYQITPLIPSSVMILFNMTDHSLSLSPQIEYNIAENIYLSAGAYVGIGKRPETETGSRDPTHTRYHSEFGAYPDIFYTSFSVYF